MATKDESWLTKLHLFNGVTATIGGIGLMTGWTPAQPEWIEHTSFTSVYFPGLILFAVVGGSSLLAAMSVWKRLPSSSLVSLLAGLILVFWIVGEVASIRSVHFLQLIYLFSGVSVIYLTLKQKPN